MQRTSSFPTMHQRDPHGIHRHVLYCLSRRCTHILQQPTTTPARCQEYPRSNKEIGNEGQTFQMRIPQGGNRVPRVYHQPRRNQDRPSQDTSHMGLEDPKEQTDIQSFLGFCNFYRRFIEGFSRTVKSLYDRTQIKYDGK